MRDARAEGGKLLRELQELDNLGELLLGLVLASNVHEGDGRLLAGKHAGAAATE